MANKSMARDYYEMRRGGEVLCGSSIPNMGYPVAWLRDMARHEIHLYKNGKRVKLCEVT